LLRQRAGRVIRDGANKACRKLVKLIKVAQPALNDCDCQVLLLLLLLLRACSSCSEQLTQLVQQLL
jgi:hypothetical protein